MIPHAKDFGYSQQWNFAIQHQFAGAFSAEIAYVGTKGTRLQTSRAINAPLPGPGNVQPRRPYPDFGAITWNEQSASSIYHALQTKLERRFYKGLSVLASFTWSKNIDQDSDNTEGAYDPYNFRLNRGLSSFDVPRLFTTGLVYELPWLRKTTGPWACWAAGRWGPCSPFRTGFPTRPDTAAIRRIPAREAGPMWWPAAMLLSRIPRRRNGSTRPASSRRRVRPCTAAGMRAVISCAATATGMWISRCTRISG